MLFRTLKAVNNELQLLSESTLREGILLFLQLSFMGRGQDPHCFLDGIEIYSKGVSSWHDVPVGGLIGIRLYDTKDAKLKNCDLEALQNHYREVTDAAHGKFSSRFWITRRSPAKEIPDYFEWVHEYKRRMAVVDITDPRTTHRVKVDRQDGKGKGKGNVTIWLPRLIAGISTNVKFRGHEVQSHTLNGIVNRLLVRGGSCSESRRDKCKHLRHTMVTLVLTYTEIHLSEWKLPPITVEMLLRSRHALQTARRTYKLVPHPDMMDRLRSAQGDIDLDSLIFYA
ncbi:MAG: hypothetical protein COB29_15510 [Sulfitobacter sp.]|nr:MAG: hypothetical protein COB29_15510 [Sulfitobacter sp.]